MDGNSLTTETQRHRESTEKKERGRENGVVTLVLICHNGDLALSFFSVLSLCLRVSVVNEVPTRTINLGHARRGLHLDNILTPGIASPFEDNQWPGRTQSDSFCTTGSRCSE